MTLDEIRAMLERELERMRKWKRRDYALERAVIDVLGTDLKDTEVLNHTLEMLEEGMREDLRNAEPEGNA